jgi:hypothetical protein
MTDKRTLTRQYKDTQRPMGVYAIRNVVEPCLFVAASLNLDASMNRDRFELKMKRHRNPRLLADWLRLGEGSFRFEVIDTLEPRDEPDHDYRPELASLLAMWCEELERRGEPVSPPAASRKLRAT